MVRRRLLCHHWSCWKLDYTQFDDVQQVPSAKMSCPLTLMLLLSNFSSQEAKRTPLGWGGFKFENWWMWPNYMDFYQIKSKLAGLSFQKSTRSAISFLIQSFLDYTQRHLVNFCKKRSANFNFIWLEWNIQIHKVWSHSSIFKLKSSPAQGCEGPMNFHGLPPTREKHHYYTLKML